MSLANVDWIAIKNEYISTNVSYKELSDKYPVSKTAIANRAKKEKWVELREENLNATYTKVVQETQDKIVSAEVDRVTKLLELTDDVQEKIAIALGQLNMYIDLSGKAQRCDMIDVSRLKKLVAALKDVKEIVRIDNQNDIDKLDAVLAKIEGNI